MQEDINKVIYEVQSSISSVLEVSTVQTLDQYENHVSDVQAEFIPALDDFDQLQPGPCKDMAEYILNYTTLFTGFEASNCASNYDIRVGAEISIATAALAQVDDLYGQVQTVVVKSFIGQNAFLTPEDIKDTITEIYNLIQEKWTSSKPEMEQIKNNLAAVIAGHNEELGNCHDNILQNAITYYALFRSNVQTCRDFEQTSQKFGSPRNYRDEFDAAFAKAKPFVWKTNIVPK